MTIISSNLTINLKNQVRNKLDVYFWNQIDNRTLDSLRLPLLSKMRDSVWNNSRASIYNNLWHK